MAPTKPKFVVKSLDCGANNKALNLGIQTFKKASPDTAVMLFSAVDDAVVCMASVPKKVNKDTGLSALEYVGCCRRVHVHGVAFVYSIGYPVPFCVDTVRHATWSCKLGCVCVGWNACRCDLSVCPSVLNRIVMLC